MYPNLTFYFLSYNGAYAKIFFLLEQPVSFGITDAIFLAV